jgi:hypothetical protein
MKSALICLMLSGCAQLAGLSSQPTPAQIQSCYTLLTAAATARSIPSAQLSADEAQLKATPPTLPLDCQGKV